LWHIEGRNFALRLREPGYTQHLRLPPKHVPRQTSPRPSAPGSPSLNNPSDDFGARICRRECVIARQVVTFRGRRQGGAWHASQRQLAVRHVAE
jgi:hypothetical protein